MDFTRCFSCMGELDRPGGRCPHCGYDNATAAKTQSSHALPCGTLLHGRYVVGKMLGQGGFGVTYIGWDLAMSQRICVKEYFPAGAAMRDAAKSATVTWSGGESAEELKRGRESFIREARKAVKLRKLNAVVQVWDVFYENDTAYLIMDYIEGVTLKSHLMETRRPLSEEECVRLLAPVMRDLEEAHARGIIHRDISPDNLMLQPDGSLVLLDIGAAKDLSGGSGQSSVLVAKKGFSPLEQYASGGNIGPWTDVYALCATIAYCVTGKLLPSPMDRLTGAELDLSAFSSAIAEVLQRGLAIRPEERIQSMRELLAAYEDAAKPGRGSWSEGEADPTAETKQEAVSTLGSSAARKKGSARRVLVPIAAVAILLLAGIVFFARQASSDPSDEARYAQAEELLNSGEYEQAAEAFVELGDYQDAADRVMEAKYAQAETLLKSGDYEQAAEAYSALGDYRDSAKATEYVRAVILRETNKSIQAFTAFRSLGDFRDAAVQSKRIAYEMRIANSVPLATSQSHSLGLRADGTVAATEYSGSSRDYTGQGKVSDWKNIVSVAAGRDHTVGLRVDGTVVAAGDNGCGECNVSSWTDIVAIVAGAAHTVGLRADGTVVAAGLNYEKQCNTASWTNIVSISAGPYHTVGIRENGTVIAVGNNDYGQCGVSGWKDIISTAADLCHTVGLQSDGTVIVAGEINYGQKDVSDWNGIKSVAAGGSHVVGLRADGTVVAVGSNRYGQCDVSDWKDIVSISSEGYGQTLGLCSDGTVIAIGDNTNGQRNVSDWKEIAPAN